MAKTLEQGRKPGSGRKPGAGKTLAQGRKPGSGRKKGSISKTLADGRKIGSGRKKGSKGLGAKFTEDPNSAANIAIYPNGDSNKHQRNDDLLIRSNVNVQDDNNNHHNFLNHHLAQSYTTQQAHQSLQDNQLPKPSTFSQMGNFPSTQQLLNSIPSNDHQLPNEKMRYNDLKLLINDLNGNEHENKSYDSSLLSFTTDGPAKTK